MERRREVVPAMTEETVVPLSVLYIDLDRRNSTRRGGRELIDVDVDPRAKDVRPKDPREGPVVGRDQIQFLRPCALGDELVLLAAGGAWDDPRRAVQVVDVVGVVVVAARHASQRDAVGDLIIQTKRNPSGSLKRGLRGVEIERAPIVRREARVDAARARTVVSPSGLPPHALHFQQGAQVRAGLPQQPDSPPELLQTARRRRAVPTINEVVVRISRLPVQRNPHGERF